MRVTMTRWRGRLKALREPATAGLGSSRTRLADGTVRLLLMLGLLLPVTRWVQAFETCCPCQDGVGCPQNWTSHWNDCSGINGCTSYCCTVFYYRCTTTDKYERWAVPSWECATPCS